MKDITTIPFLILTFWALTALGTFLVEGPCSTAEGSTMEYCQKK